MRVPLPLRPEGGRRASGHCSACQGRGHKAVQVLPKGLEDVGGDGSVLTPAAVFGGPTTTGPLMGRTSARSILTVPWRRSTSLRWRPSTSPLDWHHADSSTASL